MSEDQNLVKESQPYFDLAKNVVWALGGLAAVLFAYFQATSDIKALEVSVETAEERIHTRIDNIELKRDSQIEEIRAEMDDLFNKWNTWTSRVGPLDAVQDERIHQNKKDISECCAGRSRK